MKRRCRIWINVFLIMIYSHAVVMSTYSTLYADAHPEDSESTNGWYTELLVPQAFNHAHTAKNFTLGWNANASINSDFQFAFWALILATDWVVHVAISHRKSISGELMWNSRKSVLLFPFHTFW